MFSTEQLLIELLFFRPAVASFSNLLLSPIVSLRFQWKEWRSQFLKIKTREHEMKAMKTKTANQHEWIRVGAWLLTLAVLAAQPLLAESQDDIRNGPQRAIVPAIVFQAAGPNTASIQSTVDQFRAALGSTNNGNAPGPLLAGRREINWDGGGATNTSPGPTPFTVFLNTRGALMETPGSGFVQAPAPGLADTFLNPSLATNFQAFSPVRLFAPIHSTVTDVTFFVPGGGNIPAITTGFGVVFADVDSPDGGGREVRQSKAAGSSQIAYYDADGKLLYRTNIPSSPGTATLSFFGIVFPEPRIAFVRIVTGRKDPGEGSDPEVDLVVMDDFIYGEPQVIP
jgi:hypothetical protein